MLNHSLLSRWPCIVETSLWCRAVDFDGKELASKWLGWDGGSGFGFYEPSARASETFFSCCLLAGLESTVISGSEKPKF
jgi:hypothetical protein